MQIQIIPTAIKGTVVAPASKSIMQRACAAALLRNGETLIANYGKSDDDKAAVTIIQQLGAKVQFIDDRTLQVISDGTVNPSHGAVLDCGESGLSLRMFTPIAALSAEEVFMTARGSLVNRPTDFFNDIFPLLGVDVSSLGGVFPIRVTGPLAPQKIAVDGSVTSQFLTGLLFAYSASKGTAVSIEVKSLKSRPYIDLSLKVMEDFKMNLPVNKGYESFLFAEREAPVAAIEQLKYTVEGDWSNAAFLLVAGAIAGDVTVKGLDVFTSQSDKRILEALQDCGCRLSIQATQIQVKYQTLNAFHFDATECPDLFPPLAVLAACCTGTSVIEGVHRLAHKESDRGETIRSEFKKMGIAVDLQGDSMIITGGTEIKSAEVDSHNDHRIAMACALLALRANGMVTLDRAQAVNKSYPDFYRDMNHLCDATHFIEQL